METRTEFTRHGKKYLIKLVVGNKWSHVKFEKEGELPKVYEFDKVKDARYKYDAIKYEYAV